MSNKIKYRADIDGLRAVAVLSVILFHFNHTWLPSGFIGVDIFFVISGFIITSVIYPQMQAKTFSFNLFYVKRIKRILPLFYLVALFTIIVTSLLYMPDDFINFAKSLRYSSGFSSNIYFTRELAGYFAPQTATLPLLHTWSLSIEEQFYFGWPLLLILSLKFTTPKQFLILSIVSLLLLTAYSEYSAQLVSTKSYYSTLSRLFELLIGAITAVFIIYLKDQKITIKENTYKAVNAVAITSLIIAFFTLDATSSFPGINAFWVVFSVALILFSGQSNGAYSSKLLATPIFTFIGKISYSLYLWHWPILAFYRYYFDKNSVLGILTCAFITLLVSLLSWHFVENKLRYLSIKKRWVYLFYLIIPISISISIAINIDKNDGYPSRLTPEALSLYQKVQYRFYTQRLTRPKNNHYQAFEPYLLGDNKGTKNNSVDALVWGDSHAVHFNSFIDLLGNKYHFNALYAGGGGCPPIFEEDRDVIMRKGKYRGNCKKDNVPRFNTIKKSNASIVFLAARWEEYFILNDQEASEITKNGGVTFRDALTNTIKELVKEGKTAILFQQVPSFTFYPSNCLIKQANYPWRTDLTCTPTIQNIVPAQLNSHRIIESIKKEVPELITVSLNETLCDKFSCKIKIDNTPLYYDSHHLNYEGAISAGKLFLESNDAQTLTSTLINIYKETD